jgi:hypothetical protein
MAKNKEIKSLPHTFLLRIIKKIKNNLKKDPVMIDIFNEYNLDIDEIDYIPVYFKDLDVSAKCDHAIVYLNWKLLEDGFDLKDNSYLIHEFTHFCQQSTGDHPTRNSDDGEYLDNKYEQEGFQNQVEYISDHFGTEEAEDYVDNLLEYHEVDDGKKRKELEDVLLEKI